MTDPSSTRRRCLAGLAASLSTALAGCGALGSTADTPTADAYPFLEGQRVFVDPSLSIERPEGVRAAAVPWAADVIVVPDDTDWETSTVVDWLAAGRLVAILGEHSESTYHDWKTSDAYADAFGEPRAMAESQGSSGSSGGLFAGGSSGTESGELPEFVAAWAVGDERTTTYRVTWGGTDDPSDAQIFDAVDDALDPDP